MYSFLKRCRRLFPSALLSPLLALVAALPAHAAPDARPNVVLIYADDLGYGDVGCYGATKVETPNIDRLAEEGRMFTDAHSASSVCTPSRYAILTGEYPYRCRRGMRGRWMPANHESGLRIDVEQYTLGDLFKDAGYATACIGKWHLGFQNSPTDWSEPLRPGPLEIGFDYYFGVPKVNSGPPYVYVENDRVYGHDPDDPLLFDREDPTPVKTYPEKVPNYFGGAKRAHELYVDNMVGTELTKRAVKWIEEHQDEPFLLYFPTTNIHHPFTPHPRFKGTSECGLYGDFIHELDWIVGEVLKTLDDLDLADNTLVVFASDNGGMLNLGGREAWKHGHRMNGDLQGFKFGVWEGGHRVPFIVRWPGKVPAGSVSDQFFVQTDLLATFAEILEQPLEEGAGQDSIDMTEAFTGDPGGPLRTEAFLAPSKKSHLSVRENDWVYVDAQGSGGFGNGLYSVVTKEKVHSDIRVDNTFSQFAPSNQLYNLGFDQEQRFNVVREYPEIAKHLQARITEFLSHDSRDR